MRWVRYQPVPEKQVEALFYYVRQQDNLHLAGAVETLDTAKHWQSVVLPDIAEHYRDQQDQQQDAWEDLLGMATATTTTTDRTTVVPSRSNTVLTTE